MMEQWSKAGAAFLVVAIVLLAFGIISVIATLALIAGCFAGAFALLRSASSDWNDAEPPKMGATDEELRIAKKEIEESVDRNYRSAEAALEKTLLDWEDFVDDRLGVNIFDGVNDVGKWPLNSPEVRRHTGWAVEEYLKHCANPAESTLEKAQRTGRLDDNNFRLRAAVGAHFAGAKTGRKEKS